MIVVQLCAPTDRSGIIHGDSGIGYTIDDDGLVSVAACDVNGFLQAGFTFVQPDEAEADAPVRPFADRRHGRADPERRVWGNVPKPAIRGADLFPRRLSLPRRP